MLLQNSKLLFELRPTPFGEFVAAVVASVPTEEQKKLVVTIDSSVLDVDCKKPLDEDTLFEDEDECKVCLENAKEECLDQNSQCVDVEVCSDRLSCSIDDHNELTSECYPLCDNSLVDVGVLSEDLKACACNLCELECDATCAEK